LTKRLLKKLVNQLEEEIARVSSPAPRHGRIGLDSLLCGPSSQVSGPRGGPALIRRPAA
jgi:hypothetical protein